MALIVSVAQRVEDATRHGLLDLAHCNLSQCPASIFTSSPSSLVRLDLSGNLLTGLPDTIASLTSLQCLWLGDNIKLTALPPSLAQCAQLRVLDARSTALHSLPCELARVATLRVLDISDTPLEKRWLAKRHLALSVQSPFTADAQRERCQQILRKLQRKDERTRLKKELHDKLRDELYRVERSDVQGDACVKHTIQRLLKQFPIADEIRSVLRNAERLFPSLAVGASLRDVLEKLDAMAFRTAFDALRTDNERKKRAADLELKIRALYFDRMDPSTVEGMVQSIYREVVSLSDVNFLIKHAATLFPKDPKDVDGKSIYARLVALQEELARERQAAIDKVRAAVKIIYSDTEPDQVQALVVRVAALFKSTTDLRSLAADAAALFPSEFLNAQAAEIRAVFLRQKAESLGGGGRSSSSSTAASSTKKNRA